jgi:hypothetical protein
MLRVDLGALCESPPAGILAFKLPEKLKVGS